MARIPLLATLIVAALSLAGGLAMAADDCTGTKPVTLTGRMRAVGTIQEEPGETPQTHFSLDLLKPWCGLTTIQASLPGPVFCVEGAVVTLTGDYDPPRAPMWMAGFHGRTMIACKISALERKRMRRRARG